MLGARAEALAPVVEQAILRRNLKAIALFKDFYKGLVNGLV